MFLILVEKSKCKFHRQNETAILDWFGSISTNVGYLMSNPSYTCILKV